MLVFGRQRKPERYPVQVNQLIEDTVELVSHQLLSDSIQVECDLSKDIPPVLADPYQLQQVWLNLIHNAQHAMRSSRDQGVLQVQTLASAGGKIRIQISDNGPGKEPEVLQNILTPSLLPSRWVRLWA